MILSAWNKMLQVS